MPNIVVRARSLHPRDVFTRSARGEVVVEWEYDFRGDEYKHSVVVWVGETHTMSGQYRDDVDGKAINDAGYALAGALGKLLETVEVEPVEPKPKASWAIRARANDLHSTHCDRVIMDIYGFPMGPCDCNGPALIEEAIKLIGEA